MAKIFPDMEEVLKFVHSLKTPPPPQKNTKVDEPRILRKEFYGKLLLSVISVQGQVTSFKRKISLRL